MTPIGNKVQQFYNTTPFPDYELERFERKEDLELLASPFAKILDRSIPEDASIIDVGTGTGQLSAFLSLRRKKVYGIDFSESSLKKARALKNKLNLETWQLRHINIFDEKQMKELGNFDYILCLGVLHHTEDAYKGFQQILHLAKPNAHIAVGLYNSFGRIPLNIRKFVVHSFSKENENVKEWFIKMQIGTTKDKEKKRGWWNDQYLHPHETTHTIGEVLDWFQKNDVEFYQTTPSTKLFDESITEIAGVWNKELHYPHIPTRTWTQIKWIWETHHEGGYWITFGRKRG